MMDVSLVIGLVGCLVGLAGWLYNRDKKTGEDSEFRGRVDGKLDSIQSSVAGVRADIDRLDTRVTNQGERIAKVEASASQAHHRLDDHLSGKI